MHFFRYFVQQLLQQVLKTLDQAFKDMKKRGFGFPRFKKIQRSLVFPSMLKNCLAGGKVKLPQLGWVRIRQSRDYPQGFTVKPARIVKKASGYYLMLVFKGVVCKQSLNSGIGSFINEILPYVAWKRGKYYAKVDKNYTSQTCPNCGIRTGKKKLTNRVHECNCVYQVNRDVAAAKVIEQRGQIAVGQPVVFQNACGDDATGFQQLELFELVGNL